MSTTDKKWSAKQERLIEWLTYSKYDRVPSKQGDLARELGVREETLSRWKRDPDLWEEVRRRIREGMTQARAEVYSALIRKAAAGEFQHIKLVLEMLNDIEPGHSENTVTIRVKYADD